MSVVVLDVVGLTPRVLAHMPHLRAVADTGFTAQLDTVLPAVTCSVQSTFLTGEPPTGHGIVGNGWYDRDMGEVAFWRQHNRLVGGEKVWQTARRTRPGLTVANICWWYAMGADVDITVTPAPSTTTTAASPPTATPARPNCATNSPRNWVPSPSSTTGDPRRASRPRAGSSTPPAASSTGTTRT